MTAREHLARLSLLALTLAVLAVIGLVIVAQWRAVTLDCELDPQTGIIRAVPQDSLCNFAGAQPDDVVLRVDGVPFAEWKNPDAENHLFEIRRADDTLVLEMPFTPYALVNLPALLSALLVTLTYWGVGAFALGRRPRQFQVRLFFLLLQSAALGLVFFLAYPQSTYRPAWMEIASVLGLHFAGALVLHYYLTFPVMLGAPRQRRAILGLVYGLMLVSLAVRLGLGEWGVRVSFLYNTAEIVAALLVQLYAYARRATPDGRRRLRLVIFGNLATAIPPLFFYLIPAILGSTERMPGWLVGLWLIIAPLCYFAAMARHNVFGIDRLLNRTIVYAILSFGILLLYLGPFLLVYRFAPNDWLAQVWLAAGLTLLVGLSFEWTRARVQRGVDRFFYGGWYDYPGVVETISGALAHCIERAQWVEVLTRRVPALMLLREGKVSAGETPPVAGELAVPLTFQNTIRATWVVGARRDGEEFGAEDHRILTTLARQAETALGNILLVETLREQLAEIRASRETLTQAQHQLLRSREDERARLARDLHDGPIQDLVGLNMQLGLLLADLPNHPDQAGTLQAMRGEVRALLGELRQVCVDLRPPMLDTLGLGAALRAHAEEWSAQTGVAVDLASPPDATLRALPSEVAVNLYRVAQEVLANIARHAHARHVAIRLARDETRLTVTIRDDGCGFDVPANFDELATQGHFGLVGLRERVMLIGGVCVVESAPNAGTTVQIAVPV